MGLHPGPQLWLYNMNPGFIGPESQFQVRHLYVEALRSVISTGHAAGSPIWGQSGLSENKRRQQKILVVEVKAGEL